MRENLRHKYLHKRNCSFMVPHPNFLYTEICSSAAIVLLNLFLIPTVGSFFFSNILINDQNKQDVLYFLQMCVYSTLKFHKLVIIICIPFVSR